MHRNRAVHMRKCDQQGGEAMQIEIKLDAACTEPKIVIVTNKVNDDVQRIMEKLKEEQPSLLAGFKNGAATVLNPSDIYRVFAQSGKVLAETKEGVYHLHLRLYEAEEQLNQRGFVRISNSDLVNLAQVKRFDLSFAGTIHVQLSNGTETYVSRRYVTKIKQLLGIRGGKK